MNPKLKEFYRKCNYHGWLPIAFELIVGAFVLYVILVSIALTLI